MFESIVIGSIAIVVGVTVLINFVGPLIIWQTQTLPAVVKFETLDDEILNRSINRKFMEYDQELASLGFKIIGSSQFKDDQTTSYFKLYWNQDISTAAMVVTMSNKQEELTYLEFNLKYSDGTMLDVMNSNQPEAYPPLDVKRAYRFPKVKSAEELLEKLKIIRAKVRDQEDPVVFDINSGFSEVESFIRLESDALVKKGIVHEPIDDMGKRRLTLYGAYILTWRSIPPGKNIVGYLSERESEKALMQV